MYNDKFKAGFVDQLPQETKYALSGLSWRMPRQLKRFPHFRTMFEDWDTSALTNAQINLLSAQAEHMVYAASDIFKHALGK